MDIIQAGMEISYKLSPFSSAVALKVLALQSVNIIFASQRGGEWSVPSLNELPFSPNAHGGLLALPPNVANLLISRSYKSLHPVPPILMHKVCITNFRKMDQEMTQLQSAFVWPSTPTMSSDPCGTVLLSCWCHQLYIAAEPCASSPDANGYLVHLNATSWHVTKWFLLTLEWDTAVQNTLLIFRFYIIMFFQKYHINKKKRIKNVLNRNIWSSN